MLRLSERIASSPEMPERRSQSWVEIMGGRDAVKSSKFQKYNILHRYNPRDDAFLFRAAISSTCNYLHAVGLRRNTPKYV